MREESRRKERHKPTRGKESSRFYLHGIIGENVRDKGGAAAGSHLERKKITVYV